MKHSSHHPGLLPERYRRCGSAMAGLVTVLALGACGGELLSTQADAEPGISPLQQQWTHRDADQQQLLSSRGQP
ncbi:MAG: hypothetical protein ACKOFG_07775 [Limnohabitans sp.]